jgi:hypothetical protein
MRRTPLTTDENNTSSYARRKRVDLVAETKSFGTMSCSPERGVATYLLPFCPERILMSVLRHGYQILGW